MADQPKGINVRLMDYIKGGGLSVDEFALGYHQSARFMGSVMEQNPDWSDAQRAGYDAGTDARREDDALLAALKKA